MATTGPKTAFDQTVLDMDEMSWEILVLHNNFDKVCIGNQKDDPEQQPQQIITDANMQYDDLYVTTKVLSKTLFGDLRIAVHRTTKKIRAVKKFSKVLMQRQRTSSGVFVRENFDVELNLMNRLRQFPHDSLIAGCPEHEQIEDPEFRYIVMPYAPEGDLLGFIDKNRGKIPDGSVHDMFLQLVSALQHLHMQIGYIHGDISPENILISYDAKGRVRAQLCDYGLACKIGSQHHCSGKLSYKAPEHFFKQSGTAEPSCDVFSLGVVMFIMYYGIPPFKSATMTDVYYQGLKKCRYKASTFACWLRQWGIDKERSEWKLLPIVLSMLNSDRERRPTLAHVKEAMAGCRILHE